MSAPYLWQPTSKAGTYVDLATHFLEQRTLFLGPELTSEVASPLCMQLLALAQEDGPITLYINCYGGSVPAGLAIIDMINAVNRPQTPVRTCCVGESIGIATVILVSGWRGERRAFPSARISLYQEWHGVETLYGAQTRDMDERTRLLNVVEEIIAANTDQHKLPRRELQGGLSMLSFLTVDEAIAIDLIDGKCGVEIQKRVDALPLDEPVEAFGDTDSSERTES